MYEIKGIGVLITHFVPEFESLIVYLGYVQSLLVKHFLNEKKYII